jgi:hypothetical protein
MISCSTRYAAKKFYADHHHHHNHHLLHHPQVSASLAPLPLSHTPMIPWPRRNSPLGPKSAWRQRGKICTYCKDRQANPVTPTRPILY